MKLFIGALLMTVLSASAFAIGWGVQTRIAGYYVWDNGQAYIKTDNNQNPDGCGSTLYLSIDTTSQNFKAIWAQVIAAHTADQTVSLYYHGCDGAYPKVRAISVPNAW